MAAIRRSYAIQDFSWGSVTVVQFIIMQSPYQSGNKKIKTQKVRELGAFQKPENWVKFTPNYKNVI